MRLTTGHLIRSLGLGALFALLAAGLATSIEARSGHSAPRSGGGGQHGASPGYRGAPAPRAATPRATAPHATAPRAAAAGYRAARGTVAAGGYPAHGTAHGVARYGYGYGYGYGYPYWGAGWGWYGAGWYGDWWWGWPYYGYGAYWPYYGYGPYTDSYVVAVEAPPPSGPATVETRVTPSKADVVLDGETVGFASDYNGRWDKLSVAPGPHTIAFQEKGYRTLVITFEARPGATYAFNDALVSGDGEDRRELPQPPAAAVAATSPQAPSPYVSPGASPVALGRLRVHAEPPDAAVYLDGEYLGLGAELGRIHGALAVATGAHRLEAVRPGYVSASLAIEVGDTEVANVEITLTPQH